ncbi:MAG: cytochrome-c oxidase, cbb3-type subunit III [Proteobacteria bacterium]|nr:cytochrome-c oxidase, cbb3-type subunit III [Pseudomonadota bacterium]NOG61594.1 cytochrome-c oxidase, cbb3-type subunit III [Pseudomonadota bacterium]
MTDFTSGFWTWFISLTTIASIVFLFVFLLKFSKKRAPGEKSETMGHVWDENLEELNTPLPRWWMYWFLITIVWGAGYLVFYPGLGSYAGTLGWTQVSQLEEETKAANETYGPLYEQFKNTDIEKLAQDEAAIKVGERLFASYCTTCHGSDARGARGFPNLRDDDWLYGGDPEAIKTTIMQGRAGAMPAWAQILSEEDIFNVVSYVEQLANRTVDETHASSGKDIFMKNCAMCHGAEGKGNPMMGAPNLTDDIWLYGGSQKKITESIVLGRNGKMPAHKEFLGEAKVHVLAAYIYSFSK